MSKIDTLKASYQADADVMAGKARFGYFSVLPSHTAAHTDFAATPSHKDGDGRVLTQPRNIYGGAPSTGSLRKNYFSYVPSPFHGSPYQDPGKVERHAQLEESKKWEEKDGFKPAKLNKTLMSASYPYISSYDPKRDQKKYRDANGRVITENPNVMTSPQSKLQYKKSKDFKYTECPVKKAEVIEIEPDTDKNPFRTGIPKKEVFTTDYQAYFDAELKKKEAKPFLGKSASHEGPFKPSCISKADLFKPVSYLEEGKGKDKEVKVLKKENKDVDPFKLVKVEHNSKPCPSISLSKVNLLRICR